MTILTKQIKIVHQGSGSSINIPKIVIQLMKLKDGDKVTLDYDIDNHIFTVSKIEYDNN